MASVGACVVEIRIEAGTAYRVFYVAKFPEAIYVIHGFEKQTQQTPRADIDLAKKTAERSETSPAAKEKEEMTTKIRRSSGNVFRDLDFSEEEAEHLKIRASLMVQIREVLEMRRLTQARAAELFGVSQPRISDLVRGKIALFSIDTLVDMLAHAGIRVSLSVQGKLGVA